MLPNQFTYFYFLLQPMENTNLHTCNNKFILHLYSIVLTQKNQIAAAASDSVRPYSSSNSLYRFHFPSDIIFLGIPLTFLLMQIHCWWIISDFCLSEKGFILSLFLKDIFAKCSILGWHGFSSVAPVSSSLHCSSVLLTFNSMYMLFSPSVDAFRFSLHL